MKHLAERIDGFIRQESGERFGEILHDLFRYQYAENESYRRLCVSAGLTPSTIDGWKEIPAVPARAFKLFDLSCTPTEEAAAVFYSSGTTSKLSSRHWMDREALTLYEASLSINYFAHFPERQPIWAVMPSSDEAPHSSLSHMTATLGALHFTGANLAEFGKALLAATVSGIPITLFGTAFGLMELLSLGAIPLPFESRIVETGGFKGRRRELGRAEFYHALREGFAVPNDLCCSEYGMCELASQFYSQGIDGHLSGPHWTSTRCIDPMTNDDALAGAPGLLRHYDLANLNSVAVIQTQDRAVMHSDGTFQLLGRASDADLRGCSLTAEELWSS